MNEKTVIAFRNALFLLVLAIIIGCGATAQTKRFSVFDPADFNGYDWNGTGSISGQAFLKTAGGDVKYGAGNDVLLVLANGYMKEVVMDEWVGGMTLVPGIDRRASEFIRRVTADGEGRFIFEKLPPGNFYITCDIRWQFFNGNYHQTTGAVAWAEVQLADGENKTNVVVTQR